MPGRISSPPIAPSVAKPASSTPSAKPASGLPNAAMAFPIDQASVKSGTALNTMTTAPIPLAPGAKLETRFETEGPKVEKVALGGVLAAQTGGVKVSTVNHHARGGTHQQGVQVDVTGPGASYTAKFNKQSALGETSGQVAALITSNAQALAQYTVDTKNHVYSASASARTNVSMGVMAEAEHDFNGVDASVYAKGSAKAGVSAAAEGRLTVDPKNRTFVLAGKVGAAATAETSATFGGHIGRLSAKVEMGAVAGAAATAGGELSYQKGKLHIASEVKTATGVGSRIKTEVTLDTSSHRRSLKQGLVNSGLVAMTMGLPIAAQGGPMKEPAQSALGALFKSSQLPTQVARP